MCASGCGVALASSPPALLPLPGGGEPGAPGLIGGPTMLCSAGAFPAAGAIPAQGARASLLGRPPRSGHRTRLGGPSCPSSAPLRFRLPPSSALLPLPPTIVAAAILPPAFRPPNARLGRPGRQESDKLELDAHSFPRTPHVATHTEVVSSEESGHRSSILNRRRGVVGALTLPPSGGALRLEVQGARGRSGPLPG